MPITRIPIVHKFGIISHSQRLELQERLLKQSYLQSLGNKHSEITSHNELEVTEDFIHQMNNVSDFTEQEKLEALAYKILERVKRKAGLKDGGVGSHVNLPIAWSELTQLAQCRGKIQHDSLDILLSSLDQAPLDKQHIAALCYLAEMVLYWLRTDSVNEPYLRTVELKLLKMGQLVFMRLFYHHMSGHLISHEEAKDRLFTYLDGFTESQPVYSPYPNALLSLRYILEVGRIILGETTGAGEDPEVTEEIKLKAMQQQAIEAQLEANDSARDDVSSRQSVVDMMYGGGGDTAAATRHTDGDRGLGGGGDSAGGGETPHSGVEISNSVHDLSPTLWHALDVWKCVRYQHVDLPKALTSLSNCALKLATESWVDAVTALQILGDAAKNNEATLKELQSLARGVKPKSLAESSCGSKEVLPQDSVSEHVTSLGTSFATQPILTNIVEYNEANSATTSSSDLPQQQQTATQQHSGLNTSPSKTDRPQHGTQRDRKQQQLPVFPEKTMSSGLQAPPTTAMHVEVGSYEQGLGSDDGSQATYTNPASLHTPGVHGWHWEVAVTYTDMLADVCLHATVSTIQKRALLGLHKDISALRAHYAIATTHHNNKKHAKPGDGSEDGGESDGHKTRDEAGRGMHGAVGGVYGSWGVRCPMFSAALLDLVMFRALDEKLDGGSNDWSWRVRYSALQGLVKICRCTANDSTKEGIRTVAWNTLLQAHSQEQDNRVLEALKVGQVDANIEKIASQSLVVSPSTLGGKTAASLSKLYLPKKGDPFAKTEKPQKSTKAKQKVVNFGQNQKPKTTQRKPLRTSLRNEIQLATALYEPAPSFEQRTTFDLRRLVEDQWRKEQQAELKAEESARLKELDKKQRATEQVERSKEERQKANVESKANARKANRNAIVK